MSTSLSASIEKLRKSSSHLNTISDSTNETVRTIEEILRDEFKIGTPAFIKTGSEEDCSTYLEYRKIGNIFRIAVVWADEYGERESAKPWSDCTRKVKIDTIKHLPALLVELTKKVDEQLQQAEDAEEVASEVYNSILMGE